LRLLEHPRFANGTLDTSFLDTDGAALAGSGEGAPPPFVQAAVAEHARLSPSARTSPVAIGSDPWTDLRAWRPWGK
jgi:hypothetical protein